MATEFIAWMFRQAPSRLREPTRETSGVTAPTGWPS
jgi:hypothetical protein